ncbi:MAG TPA: anaerobic glycerol-3-phosphate dehydrogenase subunit GlpB [Candidatus Limnocylindrales bacterium]|nr:anaerobic glycerol-3-phosphate dehydrogenase subunit GlpB [Candidatus Limnocylindrales bacterium]
MPRADVGVVGAGLSGLTAAIAATEAGARVHVLATGQAATHWSAGGIDAGIARDARTPREAAAMLAAEPGHPYGFLGGSLAEAVDWLRAVLANEGFHLIGTLDDPLRPVPTAIGATRMAAILPDAAAAALPAWEPDETLVVCGPAGFRDFWPESIAASLRRPGSWRGAAAPSRIVAVSVEIPGLVGRRNLSGLDLARAFDEAAWRDAALDAIARAVEGAATGRGRVALPAVLGLQEHAAVLAAARERLSLVPFEIPLVPPSVPGLRLYAALRSALLRRGGRLQVGEAVHGSVEADGMVRTLLAPAAAREFVLSVGAVVLATGGIASGGIVGTDDGRLVEAVLGLPVRGPVDEPWLRSDPFDPAGHPLETAGIATDDQLRPLDPAGGASPVVHNVLVAGSLLAGQRYLRQRCGDGVAIASGLLAGRGAAGQAGGRDSLGSGLAASAPIAR